MARPNYAKPPITEAVVQLSFDRPLPPGLLDQAKSNLMAGYSRAVDMASVNLEYNVDTGKADAKTLRAGWRLSDENETHIAVLKPESLAVSRTAIYDGWERLEARVKHDLATITDVERGRSMVRIGCRFINRIDIPYEADGRVSLRDYVHVGLAVPDILQAFNRFVMRAEIPLPSGHLAILQHASIDSPLVNAASLLLDIDVVSLNINLPENYEGLWEILPQMHEEKNSIFEACISDRARELFS